MIIEKLKEKAREDFKKQIHNSNLYITGWNGEQASCNILVYNFLDSLIDSTLQAYDEEIIEIGNKLKNKRVVSILGKKVSQYKTEAYIQAINNYQNLIKSK